MRVAIAQVDGKWPNLALAKLVARHRQKGNDVRLFSPLEPADLTLASKIFTDTPDDPYLPDDAVRGGSGYSLSEQLSDFAESARPDWSLWPAWQNDMGYSTRGCVRRCPFCVVPEKEGKPRVVAEFGDLTTGRKTLKLLDANVLASPIDHLARLCRQATERGVELDFTQGLDARLLDDRHAAILAKTKLARRIHLAFDSSADEYAVRRAIGHLTHAGIPAHRLTFYVLIGWNRTPLEDWMYRVQLIDQLGCDPFVMPFNKADPQQRRFSRWVNRKELFKSCAFAEYVT